MERSGRRLAGEIRTDRGNEIQARGLLFGPLREKQKQIKRSGVTVWRIKKKNSKQGRGKAAVIGFFVCGRRLSKKIKNGWGAALWRRDTFRVFCGFLSFTKLPPLCLS